MAKTVFENEEKLDVKSVSVGYEPKVKQMVRKVGPNPNESVSYIETVDAELSSYINVGWKLSFVERIATEPDGHVLLYVLTKD
jgi:hypothetical protein